MLITLIGSGNVATHFGAALKNAGHQILQVCSRNMTHAAALAYPLKAAPADRLDLLDNRADFFLISVNDDAIAQVAASLSEYGKPLVHTSGGTPMEVLLPYAPKAGVLYPVQTFSVRRELDFSTVPIGVEASDIEFRDRLFGLAVSLSGSVFEADSARRQLLHLAAVFACNFPNALYQASAQLLRENELDFSLLRPLILETALKVQNNFPASVQTGPAIRGDHRILSRHLALLAGRPELRALYELLSQLIIKMDNPPHEGA